MYDSNVNKKTRFQLLSCCISSIQMSVIAGLPLTFHFVDNFFLSWVGQGWII